MEHYPAMYIRFPSHRETELHADMRRRATPPWSPKETDALDRPVRGGFYYFHRDMVGAEASCTLCIARVAAGHWVVQNIVPDKGQISQIPIDMYTAILNEFDSMIAEPAAELVEGMTAIEISQYRLQDYFSPRARGLLEAFCSSSNQADLGTHLSDQEKWIRFLLAAFDDGNDVHCDVFGYCLRTAGWWPEVGIPRLVHEYDFAMRLLEQLRAEVDPDQPG